MFSDAGYGSMRTSGPLQQDRQLLTVEDAAAYLDISPGTLRNWLSERRITYVKVGRLTRVRRSVLDAYIEQNTVKAA